MNEYQTWFQIAHKALNSWWEKSMGLVLAAVVSFAFGTAWENRQITEDCKFMGGFRDGTQAYVCQLRAR